MPQAQFVDGVFRMTIGQHSRDAEVLAAVPAYSLHDLGVVSVEEVVVVLLCVVVLLLHFAQETHYLNASFKIREYLGHGCARKHKAVSGESWSRSLLAVETFLRSGKISFKY